jgi:hypothetical protein
MITYRQTRSVNRRAALSACGTRARRSGGADLASFAPV